MRGIIYKITSSQTDKEYIGQTTVSIGQRMSDHKYYYKQYKNPNTTMKRKNVYYSSFEVVKYNDAKIEIVEEIDFDDKDVLNKLEAFHIQKNPKSCNKLHCNRENLLDILIKADYEILLKLYNEIIGC